MSVPSRTELCHQAKHIELFAQNQQCFTKSDMVLANYIAQNYQQFLHMTILDLANATALSEITISRFCKKLKLAGVQALKIKLAYCMPVDTSFPAASRSNDGNSTDNGSNRAFSNRGNGAAGNFNAAEAGVQFLHGTGGRELPSSDIKDITGRIFSAITDGLNQSLKVLDFEALEQAAQALNKSRRVMLFGYGNSFVVCQDMATRFIRFGLSCEASADLHQQITMASVCDQDTVIIAISYSGSSLHLDKVLSIAREHKATVILMSSYTNSAAAKQADILLIGVTPYFNHTTEASMSRIIYSAIADALYARLTMLRSSSYYDNLHNSLSSLALLKS